MIKSLSNVLVWIFCLTELFIVDIIRSAAFIAEYSYLA